MDEERLGQESPVEEETLAFNEEPEGIEEELDYFKDPAPEGNLPAKKTNLVRILLLLILLIGIAVAGLYLFGQDPSSSDVSGVASESQTSIKMKVPERPESKIKSEILAEKKITKKVAEVLTTVTPAPVVAEKLASAPGQPVIFTLETGNYLEADKFEKVRSLLEKQGYQTELVRSREQHSMYRLLVGVYGKPLAQKRLEEVTKISDGAFLAAEEGKFAVYAGSFLSAEKARRLADTLYKAGVKVMEKRAPVELPVSSLRFGGFATRAEAEKALRGLDSQGLKNIKIVPVQ